MKVTRKYKADVVDNRTLQPGTAEGEVELPDSYPTRAYARTALGRIAQDGKTAVGMEIDGQQIRV